MKTQIQYPTGLSITIDHEIEVLPQLLETKEDVLSDDITKQIDELIGKNESLRRTVSEYSSTVAKLEDENVELRKALSELRLENFDNNQIIDKLKEEIQKLSAEPVPDNQYRHDVTISTEKISVKNEKSAPKYGLRKCIVCGGEYQPNGPRGNTCPDCKGAASSFVNENPEPAE